MKESRHPTSRSGRFLRQVVPVLAFFIALTAGSGDAGDLLTLPRLRGEIRFDGRSDESAWQAIDPLPLTMNLPTFEGAPTERTEIRIGYDDRHLYASGRFYDSDPTGVRGLSLFRDSDLWRDDAFALVLDTFNDDENAVAFLTTPSGVRKDCTVFNDAEPSWETPSDMTWNTFWDSAVTRTEEGWFAEMRIPLASLRFQVRDGRAVMGFITWRYIARKNEILTFPAISPRHYWGTLKPSLARDAVLESIHASNPVYLTPYGIGGGGRSSILDPAGVSYSQSVRTEHEAGLDLKYGVTSNMTMDATINTDFAQVEADDEQVNLTRFSLFFPEKRLFFLERASTFDFKMDGDENLFYSRRIGLSDEGPVRIYGGLRLVGRAGPWDVGWMSLQTGRSARSASENAGVLRLQRQIYNRNSRLGGMVTSRVGTDGSLSLSYGIDGILRFRGDEYLTLKWAQTSVDAPGVRSSGMGFGTARAYAKWERRTYTGFGYEVGLARSGSGYDPVLGFSSRFGSTRLGDRVFYGWHAGETSPVQSHVISLKGFAYLRNPDRSIESAELGPEWNLSLKSGAAGQLNVRMIQEDLRDPFVLAEGVEVPAGRYRFGGFAAAFQSPYGSLRRVDLILEGGAFYDGWQWKFGLNPTLVLSRYLELGGEYEYDRIRFGNRVQSLDVQVARLRARVALSTRVSASVLAQYSSDENRVDLNIRLRYNPREGDDLYLVYNEGLNTDRYRNAPPRPLSDTRTLLVKYSRTFSR